jgi:riboflavin synthase
MEKKLFTGIVEKVGEIKKVDLLKTGEFLIRVECRSLNPESFSIGESVAVNGICLTVTKKTKTFFETLASKETLLNTNLRNIKKTSKVNLERAMGINSRFGGHIVSGHVDSVGRISKIQNSGKSIQYYFKIKKKFNKYIIEKGSITVDGISLTINKVKDNIFSVNIIPHTSENTISASWILGSIVNLEFDMIAKYIEKMVTK